VKRWMRRVHLSSRGARVHFGIAVALISVLPCLTLFYLYSSADGSHPLTPIQGVVAAFGIVATVGFGYVLLAAYPATIVRLRSHLEDVVKGELPDTVTLPGGEQDITAVEDALNVVLDRLRGRLHEVQAEKTRLEDELFQAQKLEAIGTLAAGIAHEINTPLQFVSNNAQFLRKACETLCADVDPSPDQGGDALERVPEEQEFLRAELPRAFGQLQEGISRIAQVVRAIKDFARSEDDGSRVAADLNKAVETTVEVTRNEWKYHADLETDLDPTLPAVSCFPGEIKRVLMDLILNAGQAIADRRLDRAAGRGLIRVTTRRHGEEVVLSVSDDGCGIPEGVRDRIFDPFFTTREVGAGKGCGLAFAYAAVVNRHGGKLSVSTEEHKGSTFTFSLPLNPRRDEESEGQGNMDEPVAGVMQ